MTKANISLVHLTEQKGEAKQREVANNREPLWDLKISKAWTDSGSETSEEINDEVNYTPNFYWDDDIPEESNGENVETESLERVEWDQNLLHQAYFLKKEPSTHLAVESGPSKD